MKNRNQDTTTTNYTTFERRMKMNKEKYTLIRFKDNLEEEPTEHAGIKMPNGNVICFCCGGILEPEDYDIIEDEIPWQYLDKAAVEALQP